MLNTAKADICMGHLDLNGFRMMDTVWYKHTAMIKVLYQDLKKHIVVTFTTRMMMVKYYYLGSQYEMTWSDYNNKKVFIYSIQKQER